MHINSNFGRCPLLVAFDALPIQRGLFHLQCAGAVVEIFHSTCTGTRISC